MTHVYVYTDGSYNQTTNCGGWAAKLIHKASGKEKFISGAIEGTTPSRAEILAVIKGLEALKFPCDVIVVSDRIDIAHVGNKYIHAWKANGWRRADGGKLRGNDIDLWRRLDELILYHKSVKFMYVKGHANRSKHNEEVDRLAVSVRKEFEASKQ